MNDLHPIRARLQGKRADARLLAVAHGVEVSEAGSVLKLVRKLPADLMPWLDVAEMVQRLTLGNSESRWRQLIDRLDRSEKALRGRLAASRRRVVRIDLRRRLLKVRARRERIVQASFWPARQNPNTRRAAVLAGRVRGQIRWLDNLRIWADAATGLTWEPSTVYTFYSFLDQARTMVQLLGQGHRVVGRPVPPQKMGWTSDVSSCEPECLVGLADDVGPLLKLITLADIAEEALIMYEGASDLPEPVNVVSKARKGEWTMDGKLYGALLWVEATRPGSTYWGQPIKGMNPDNLTVEPTNYATELDGITVIAGDPRKPKVLAPILRKVFDVPD